MKICEDLLRFCLIQAHQRAGYDLGVMAIGLYITYKLLEVSDLTVDGSFCTGGAVCVMMMLSGYHVWIAMLSAMLVGMLAGLVTGFFHTKCGIPAILSGILTQLVLS